MSAAFTARERRWIVGLLALVATLRLVTLGSYPLMDSTESRYAEIARKMAETGDWITPQFDYGVPFWGKPPLSTWLAAASIRILGLNEFAVRLPSFLLLLGVAAIVARLGAARGGRDRALWSLAFVATTVVAFVAAGSVMTDAALALGTTLSMAAFWNAMYGDARHRRAHGVAFFVGLAIGLLAKGPVALVLTFLPTFGWVLATGQWRAAARLPWLAGMALVAALVVPWYWAAEARTPGFLEYFLVGEHWRRFVDSGWKGDLYGAAHAHPRGMIWVFGFAALLPWSVPALGFLGTAIAKRSHAGRSLLADPWTTYLLLWTFAPFVFFTFAGNILWTYVLPGVPAFALLVAECWRPDAGADDPAEGRRVRPVVAHAVAVGAIVPLAFVAGIPLLHADFETVHSHKALVRDYVARSGGGPARLIYYRDRPPSAEFYSRGKALRAADAAALRAYLDDDRSDFLVLAPHDLGALRESDRARLEEVARYGEEVLLREMPR